jgi:hypothetical protein
MNNYAEIVILVEGQTEKIFVQKILVPYFYKKNIFLKPILLSKPGEKGGDVKFARAQRDIGVHLKQRKDTRITLMVDYYGIDSEWPGYKESKQKHTHTQKAEILNQKTKEKVNELFNDQNPARRFIPYVSMHEIESLYFSDPDCLAEKLKVKRLEIISILKKAGEPEAINSSRQTAPSKILESFYSKFKKTSTGIAIAESIGIEKMQNSCPIFDKWIKKIESLDNF